MSTLAAIKTVLESDGTLLALATGGIWDFDETGREGLNRTTTPAAFDANGILKPSVLLRLRSDVPDYVLADDSEQYVSTKEMIEAWIVSDRSHSTIESIGNRIYALLHATQTGGSFAVRWAGTFRGDRDTALDGVWDRLEFQVTTYRSV